MGFFGLPCYIFALNYSLQIFPFTLFGHDFSCSKKAALVLIAFLSIMFIHAVFLLCFLKSFSISQKHLLCSSTMVPLTGPEVVCRDSMPL